MEKVTYNTITSTMKICTDDLLRNGRCSEALTLLARATKMHNTKIAPSISGTWMGRTNILREVAIIIQANRIETDPGISRTSFRGTSEPEEALFPGSVSQKRIMLNNE
jgi:hypothetical protein